MTKLNNKLTLKAQFKLLNGLLAVSVSMVLTGCAQFAQSSDASGGNAPSANGIVVSKPLSSSSEAAATAAAFPQLSTANNANTTSNAGIAAMNLSPDTMPQPSTSNATASTPSQSTSPEPIQALGPMVNGQYVSVWDVIRSGFTLDHNYNNALVQSWIQFYTKDPSLIQNIATQSTPYLYIIVQQLEERKMPMELALLPIVESGYQPKGRSWCGAVGLWQLMPGTAKDAGAGAENDWYNARESIQGSTAAALNYLKYLYNYFNGDWLLALAAYDAGPGTVQNAISANNSLGRPTDFWDLNLRTEAENYPPKLLALSIIINDPGRYGIVLPKIPNKPILGTATIPQQMSLSQAAKFAGIGEDELKALNPAFTQNVTPPSFAGTYTLNLPLTKITAFEENCAANPGVTGLERYTMATAHAKSYGTYRVMTGDTLVSVSRFTGVPVSELKSYNHLKGNSIRKGEVLHYPIDTTAAYHYITYYVKSGDTIDRIAQKYHVSVFDLMQWNGLSSKSRLYVGERLAIRNKISY